MSRIFTLAAVLALWACASVSNASIIAAQAGDDGDGVIRCDYSNQNFGWDASSQTMNIFGDQYGLCPGHVGTHISTSGPTTLGNNAFFDTSDPLDPTVKISNGIGNDTTSAWADYRVNVYMANSFTLSNAATSSPEHWAGTITAQPAWNASAGLYEGQIDYAPGSGGAPVQTGDELDFSYKMTFSGSTHYSYTQEMIPTSVPEPGTFALSAAGFVGLLIVLRRRLGR